MLAKHHHNYNHQPHGPGAPLDLAAVAPEDLRVAPSFSDPDKDGPAALDPGDGEERLSQAQELAAALERLELSCQCSREMVKAAAERLVSQIKEHEQRLLEEIDVHHQTELKKLPVDHGSLKALAEKLKEANTVSQLSHHKESTTPSSRENSVRGDITQGGRCDRSLSGNFERISERHCEETLEVNASDNNLVARPSPPDLLEEVTRLSEGLLGWVAGYDVNDIRSVNFIPIRCNTAFGTVEAEGGSPLGGGTGGAGRRSRSVSLLGSVCPTGEQLASTAGGSGGGLERSNSLHRARSLRVSRSPSPRYDHTYPGDYHRHPHHHKLGPPPEAGAEGTAGRFSTSLRRHHSMKMPKDMPAFSVRRTWSPLTARRVPLPPSPGRTSSGGLPQDGAETVTLLWELTDQGPVADRFNSPTDVVFLPNGDLAVADRDSERIQVVSGQKGTILRTIGQGKIRPQRLAVTADGHLAVTDLKSCCVKIFTLDGRPVSSWGRKRFKSTFQSPCGLAITSRGQYVVSDMEKQTVGIHQAEGKLLHALGSHGDFHSPAYLATTTAAAASTPRGVGGGGTGTGSFPSGTGTGSFPSGTGTGSALSGTGNVDRVVVADNWSNTVKVYSASNGELLFALNDQVDYPNGVSVDDRGDILVAGWGKHRVSRFTAGGRFVRHVLTREDGVHYPAGVACQGDLLAQTEYSDTHSVVRLFRIDRPTKTPV